MAGIGTRRSPTMHDVAALAGVSHQTVSRVVNGFAGIRPDTRDRVLAAIDDLGYRRNLAARTLVTSRSRAIGVLAPAVAQFGPSSSVLAIESAARQRGYHPLVTAATPDHDATLAALGFLLDQAIEALVVIAPHQGVLDAVRELDIAIPLVTLQTPDAEGTVVGVEQAAGARLAVRHLVDLGHRVIQHLTGPVGHFEAEARRDGYLAELALAGLEAPPLLEGDWTAASGHRAATALAPGVTAVACANDQSALGLLAGLAERGVRVPEDVSVVGFDDIPEAAYLRPPLTTVAQDFAEIGRRAVAVLAARMDDEPLELATRLDARLVVRASTAPHRGA